MRTTETRLTPEPAGSRLVLDSGERRTGIPYTVPLKGPLSVARHTCGHTAEMVAQVRFVVLAAP